MPAYILRNIDPQLWATVKARSEAEGIPPEKFLPYAELFAREVIPAFG